MRIVELWTRGFKADDIRETLSPVTYIIGENESGKSHVLDAVQLIHYGQPPESGLIKQAMTAQGVMRYARNPRDGIEVGCTYDTGATVIRKWAVNRRGEVKEEITQSIDGERTGTRDQAMLLLGLLPDAALWDVRKLVNQSSGELRKQLLSLFSTGAKGKGMATALCPEHAPDWAIPSGPTESAQAWITRVMGEQKRRTDAARDTLKSAERALKDYEDAWAPVKVQNNKARLDAIEADLRAASERDRKVTEVETLERELATAQERAAMPEVDLTELERVYAERGAVVENLSTQAAGMHEALVALEDTGKAALAERRKVDLRYTMAGAELAKKPKPCSKCKHLEAWDEEAEARTIAERTTLEAKSKALTETIEKAQREVQEAKAAFAAHAKERAAAAVALDSARDALIRAQAERDAERQAREGLADLEMRVEIAKSELDGMPEVDVDALREERGRLSKVDHDARDAAFRHGKYVDAKAAKEAAEKTLDTLEKQGVWMPEVQTLVLQRVASQIEGPLTDVVGRKVELSWSKLSGEADCRFTAGGVDIAAVSDSTALLFLLGLKIAMAPLSSAKFKLATLDRWEAVSEGRRVALHERLHAAVRSGVLHQVLVAGCPDRVPAEIIADEGTDIIRRGVAQ